MNIACYNLFCEFKIFNEYPYISFYRNNTSLLILDKFTNIHFKNLSYIIDYYILGVNFC